MAAHQQRMGRLIAEARAEKGISQEDAARQIGIGNRTYQKWEAGEVVPYRRNLLKAATVLGKTVEELGGEPLEDYVEDQLNRIETKLDQLLEALPATPAAGEGPADAPDRLPPQQGRGRGSGDEEPGQTGSGST